MECTTHTLNTRTRTGTHMRTHTHQHQSAFCIQQCGTMHGALAIRPTSTAVPKPSPHVCCTPRPSRCSARLRLTTAASASSTATQEAPAPLSPAPADYDFRNALGESTRRVVEACCPELADLVEDGDFGSVDCMLAPLCAHGNRLHDPEGRNPLQRHMPFGMQAHCWCTRGRAPTASAAQMGTRSLSW